MGSAVKGSLAVARVSRRRSARPGEVGIDQRATLGEVRLGQHLVDWHVHEIRIADVLLSVGEGEVQRLAHGVDVLGGVVPHGLEVEALKDLQGLRERRPLSPRPGAVHVVALVVHGNARTHLDVILGEVVLGEQAAHFLVIRNDLAGQFASVDVVPRRSERGFPALARVGCLDIGEFGQGLRQVFLIEHLALLGGAAPGQVNLGGGRVRVVLVVGGLEAPGKVAEHGETVAGKIDGSGRHLPESHGAEPGQRRHPRIGGGRRKGRHDTAGHPAAVVLVEVLDRRGSGPHSQAIYRDDLIPVGQVDHRGRDAEETAIIDVHNIQREANGHAGVDGVSASLQYFQASHGRAGVTGCDHSVDTLHQRSITG